MKRSKTVVEYVRSAAHWKGELVQLRNILKSTGLKEEIKWGGPCYTLDGKLVVGLGSFKSYVGLWFFQGALLSDRRRVLVNAQAGVTRALRQWRFGSKSDIKAAWIKEYVREAVALQKKGAAIKPDRDKPLTVPPELKKALAGNRTAKTAFDALTRGKRREYTDYIAGAKRPETKSERLKKILPMIVRGKGLIDQYR